MPVVVRLSIRSAVVVDGVVDVGEPANWRKGDIPNGRMHALLVSWIARGALLGRTFFAIDLERNGR
jgi:hypothetical protein